MAWKQSNFARLTLIQSATVADTSMYVSAADGALMPTLAVGDKAKLVLFDGTNREIVNVTAVSGGTLTVERGKESTAARAWPSGTVAVHTPTAEILQSVLNASATIRQVGTASYAAGLYTIDIGAGTTIPSYSDGFELEFLIDTTNAVDGLTLKMTNGVDVSTTKSIYHQSLDPLEIGDFQAGWLALVRYNLANDCWILVSQTSNQLHATLLNDAPVPAVNRHPNGRVDFWNAGTSFVTPASTTITADGWTAEYDGTIGAFTVSRQSFTLGQTTVPGNPQYFIRWDQSAAGAGSTYRRFKSNMPSVAWQSGKTVSVSFWAKAEAPHNMTAKLVQNFGTGGSPSADVTATSTVCALTASWQLFTINAIAMPSVSGKTLGSSLDDGLNLYFELPTNITMTIDIAVVDVRPGDETGLQSFDFPLPTWQGGLGASYGSINSWLTANFPDLAALEALSGTSNIYYRSAANTWSSVTVAANLGFSAGTLGSALGTAATKNTGTSGNTVPLLDGANTFSAANVFTSASASTAAVTVKNTTDNASVTIAEFTGARATPTAFDNISINFNLNNAASAKKTFANILVYGATLTAAAEVGRVDMQLISAGTLTGLLSFVPGAIRPVTNDGVALGATTLSFSDIYLAAGAILNYNNGDATITHATSGNTFTFNNGTISASRPIVALSQTWNNVATTFTGFFANFTDTTSAAASLLMDFRVSTVSKFSVKKDGTITSAGGANFAGEVVLASVAPSSIYSAGYRGAPIGQSGNAAVTFALTDSGCTIYHDEVTARTYTIPANASIAFPIGSVIVIDNTGNAGAAGAITLSITTDTLRRGDGVSGTGSRTIAANGVVTIRKVTSTIWVVTGSGLT